MKAKRARHVAESRSRPTALGTLLAAPDVRVHPLRLFFLRKGVSLAQGAALLGWSQRKLMLVLNEWRTPRDADEIAKTLRLDARDLFPGE